MHYNKQADKAEIDSVAAENVNNFISSSTTEAATIEYFKYYRRNLRKLQENKTNSKYPGSMVEFSAVICWIYMYQNIRKKQTIQFEK